MKICEKCDHNVQIECQGGCFSPHRTPPCYRELEAKFTSHNSDYATASPKLPSVGEVMKFNPSLNYDDVQETLHAVYTLGNFA